VRSCLYRRLLLAAVVVGAGVCSPGCVSREPSAPKAPTMRIGVGTPKGTPNTGSRALVNLLKADTWLAVRPDGHVDKRIATEWQWDGAGTVLRLKLKPGVYFHDGTLLTPQLAADVLRATNTSNDNLSLKSVASFESEGSDTVVLRLKERNAFVLTDLGGIPVVMPGKPDLGTGAYQIVKRDKYDATLTAFPRYYRGQPSLAGVEIRNYPTQRNAWSALMRGEIDMLYEVSRDSTEFVQAETTVHTFSFPRAYYIPLVFNVRHPILRNVEVRRAINEALDRTALVRDGLRGLGSQADGPVWPQHWAYSPAQPFRFEPAAARTRLDKAGYPLVPNAERGVPIRFSFKCLVLADDSRFDRIAVIAQKELADIGIDMQLDPQPADKLVARFASGDFEAFLFEMSGRSLSRVYDFWRFREDALNNSGYRAADDVLDRIRGAQSDPETRAAVAELLRVMHDDPPAAFIAWQQTSRAVSARFDVGSEPDRDILSNLWMWRLAPTGVRAAR
jgi:peptide/nickel transport system substrate-binding protein